MAVAFGSITSPPASNNGANKATTIATPYPSGLAASDFILLAGANTSPDPWSVPTGFTLAQAGASSVVDVLGSAYYKIAVGNETGTVTLGTTTVVTTVLAMMARYTGANATPRGAALAIESSSAKTTSPVPPTVAGVVSTDMVIRIYMYGADTSAAGNVKQTITTTNLASGSWNVRLNFSAAPSSSAQYSSNIVVADKLGAADAPTVTSSAVGGWNVITLVLSAAAGGAAGGPAPGQFFPFLSHHEEPRPHELWTPRSRRSSRQRFLMAA